MIYSTYVSITMTLDMILMRCRGGVGWGPCRGPLVRFDELTAYFSMLPMQVKRWQVEVGGDEALSTLVFQH